MVELIMVIVLLGVLAMTAGSRLVRPEAFAPAVVTQALVAETRFAQQLAASRRDAQVSLTLDRLADEFRFRVATDVDGVVRTELVEAEDTTVQATSGAASATVGVGAALILTFDHTGDLGSVTVAAVPGDPALGVALQVSGGSTRVACVYPSGYVNDDACI